jgi:hypothetical protein
MDDAASLPLREFRLLTICALGAVVESCLEESAALESAPWRASLDSIVDGAAACTVLALVLAASVAY